MNTAEWIIAIILSLTLFIFLILGIALLFRLLDLARDAKHVIKRLDKIAAKGQTIANKAEATVDDVKKNVTSMSSSVKKDVTSTTGAVKDAVVNAVAKKLGVEEN